MYFSYGVAVTADASGYTADAAADIDADGFPQLWGFAKPDATARSSRARSDAPWRR